MIQLTQKQNEAVSDIIDWYLNQPEKQEYYLAGYAGTGKSTIVSFIVDALRDKCPGISICTGAFTGKAASVLRSKGAPNPHTIHGLIYKPREDRNEKIGISFELNPNGPAALADLILLDEVSMLNKKIVGDIRYFGKKILVMGDPGQLPPVKGAGEFTNREPDFFLDKIHRQAADNPIIRLATEIRLGNAPVPHDYGQGVRVIPYEDCRPYIFNPDTQIICGIHKARWTITKKLRQRKGFVTNVPQVGDRLMCCKNNTQFGIYNGQLGTLEKIESSYMGTDYRKIDVDMDDSGMQYCHMNGYLFKEHDIMEQVQYPKQMNPDATIFDFGYVLTCHKSQGSQWDNVTVIDDSDVFRENKFKWLYTAVTRAAEELTLVLR